MTRLRPLPLLVLCAVGCSETDLFSTREGLPLPPDRLALQGRLCTEDPASASFRVKTLLMVDGSLEAFVADPSGYRFCGPGACLPGSLQALVNRHRAQANAEFGFVRVGSRSDAVPIARGAQFYRGTDTEIQEALGAQRQPQGAERNIEDAVARARSFIAADIANSTPGEVLRSRYTVSMVMTGPPNPQVAPTEDAEREILASAVANLRDFVLEQGALEFRFHVGLLYYGPNTIDPNGFNCEQAGTNVDPPCPCDPGVFGDSGFCNAYCDLDAGRIDEGRNTRAEFVYEGMTIAGNGRFRVFPCAPQIEWFADIANADLRLVSKDIVAFNRNVHLREEGPQVDSDGDGRTDIEERENQPRTDPLIADTDGDGLNDHLEFRSLPLQDPTDPTDRPGNCESFALTQPDRDGDLLNDCEEGILQFSPSIPDSDGDGLPDTLEYLSGTLGSSAEDRLLDFDGDGITNGQEVVEHTQPRSNDGRGRSSEAYTNEITPLGVRNVASIEDPEALLGVRFRSASENLVGGPGFLRYEPCNRTLEWSDARFQSLPPYTPEPTTIADDGVYRLQARAPNGELIWADVDVINAGLPNCGEVPEVIASPLISVAERSCYDVRISNIKLMETAETATAPAGLNRVLVFFTQGPSDRLNTPGISRIAEIPVQFNCTDPAELSTCARVPEDGIVTLDDSLFVSIGR